jgi:hypothetical protein
LVCRRTENNRGKIEEVKEMRKFFILTLAALALWVFPLAGSALADDAGSGPCREALEEVQKTQKVLERAAPVIRDCANDSAKSLFSRARHAQGEAREALQSRQCRRAVELTLRARRAAFVALRLCGDNTSEGVEALPEK